MGINLKKKSVLKEMKKLFILYKNKKINYFHSTYYNQLQEIINNIKLNENDLSSPPLSEINYENEINYIDNNYILEKEENKEKKENMNIDIETIEDLEKFLNETFKIIDPTNVLETFRILYNL